VVHGVAGLGAERLLPVVSPGTDSVEFGKYAKIRNKNLFYTGKVERRLRFAASALA
jgi:ribosomal protein L19